MAKQPTTRIFDLWVVVKPAEDVPGEWVAHCLDIDVVTQGRDAFHAMGLAAEAISLTVVDDLENGREPGLRRAPQEFWTELYAMLRAARAIDPHQLKDVLASARPENVRAFFAQLQLTVEMIDHRGAHEPSCEWPLLWQREQQAKPLYC